MSDFDVRSSFVSVVDHLPSDIIRKLWLIQTLNINYETLKDELDLLLKEINQPDIPKILYFQKVSKISQISQSLKKIRLESLEESKSITSTIKITKLNLENQHNQLQQDRKTYQQELKEDEKAATQHEERTNKRTTTKKPIKLKLTLNKKKPSISSNANANSSTNSNTNTNTNTLKFKRPRGRPPKYSNQSTPNPIDIPDLTEGDGEVYCLCRRGDFGEMIACDNPKCKYEWFHYSCVGLTRAPRGRWNCPLCKNRKK